MTCRDLAVVVACSIICLAGLACSNSDALGGAGGRSGTTGAGGTGGAGRGGTAGADAGGGDAAGGDAGAALTVPSCLQQLYAACPETGACTVERDDAGVNQSFCYPSGVRSEYTMNGDGCAPTELRVYKPDGSLCYIEQSDRTVGANVICEGSAYTWRDAAGSRVATGSTFIGGTRIECSSTGEKLECNGNNCPPGLWAMRYGCEPGACP